MIVYFQAITTRYLISNNCICKFISLVRDEGNKISVCFFMFFNNFNYNRMTEISTVNGFAINPFQCQ
jgi:hypothetical protein